MLVGGLGLILWTTIGEWFAPRRPAPTQEKHVNTDELSADDLPTDDDLQH